MLITVRALVLPALLGLTLTACGGGAAADLADSDPNGAEACSQLAGAFENKDDTSAAIKGSFASGKAATQSTTPAIKAAVLDVGGDPAADPEKMVAACKAAGVDMPDVPK